MRVSPPGGQSYLTRGRSHKPTSKFMTRARMAVRSNLLSFAPILINLQRDCATPLPVLRHVADAMAADMRAGLAVEGGSDLKMILSYVDNLPTGYVMSFHLMPLYSFITLLFSI